MVTGAGDGDWCIAKAVDHLSDEWKESVSEKHVESVSARDVESVSESDVQSD